MKLLTQKSDNLGVFASSLCMIHCMATPFIFVAQTCTASCCATSPTWWKWIDYLFLAISFFAVYRSTQTSSNQFVKKALWFSWFALFMVIVNESLQIVDLPKMYTYIVAFVLIGFHIYNLKFCQCKDENCCTE